jgi:hypothetical protein
VPPHLPRTPPPATPIKPPPLPPPRNVTGKTGTFRSTFGQ